MRAKFKRKPPDVLGSEDVRWVEIVRDTVDGILADYKERIKETDDE